MQVSDPVLSVASASRLKLLLLALGAIAGVGAGLYVLLVEPVSDLLGEGPVRVLGIEGGTRRGVIALGLIAATAIGVAATSRSAGTWRYTAVALAVLAGLALAGPLMLPAAALLSLALAAERAPQLSRAGMSDYGPRTRPLPWAAGGIVLTGILAGSAWLTLWLVSPLIDEGTELHEELAFAITMPAPTSAAGAPPSEATSTPSASSAEGVLVATGELVGVDAFHTGSGRVLLLEGPDGGVLRFDQYAVRNGPDLHVYLTPDAEGDVRVDGAVDLGSIKATQGDVNYELPSGLDLASFRAAVIYCQPFRVTFAVATFD